MTRLTKIGYSNVHETLCAFLPPDALVFAHGRQLIITPLNLPMDRDEQSCSSTHIKSRPTTAVSSNQGSDRPSTAARSRAKTPTKPQSDSHSRSSGGTSSNAAASSFSSVHRPISPKKGVTSLDTGGWITAVAVHERPADRRRWVAYTHDNQSAVHIQWCEHQNEFVDTASDTQPFSFSTVSLYLNYDTLLTFV
jgi:hypothetical protein